LEHEPQLRLVDRFDPERLPACPSCQAILPGRWVSEAWIEVPIDHRWVGAYRIVVKDGQPLVAEVRVLPSEHEHAPGQWSGRADAVEAAVPARALRALRLSDPSEPFPKFIANISRRHGAEAAARFLDRSGLKPNHEIHPRRPGRAGRSDRYYVAWAVAYLERVAAGSRHPIKDLAADPPIHIEGVLAGRGGITEATVRDVLHQARRRRLLTKPPQGKAGGRLTARAIRIFDDVSESSSHEAEARGRRQVRTPVKG